MAGWRSWNQVSLRFFAFMLFAIGGGTCLVQPGLPLHSRIIYCLWSQYLLSLKYYQFILLSLLHPTCLLCRKFRPHCHPTRVFSVYGRGFTLAIRGRQICMRPSLHSSALYSYFSTTFSAALCRALPLRRVPVFCAVAISPRVRFATGIGAAAAHLRGALFCICLRTVSASATAALTILRGSLALLRLRRTRRFFSLLSHLIWLAGRGGPGVRAFGRCGLAWGGRVGGGIAWRRAT